MADQTEKTAAPSQAAGHPAAIAAEQWARTIRASQQLMQMPVDYWGALTRYQNDFFLPFSKSVQYFQSVEAKKMLITAPWRSFWGYVAFFGAKRGDCAPSRT